MKARKLIDGYFLFRRAKRVYRFASLGMEALDLVSDTKDLVSEIREEFAFSRDENKMDRMIQAWIARYGG